MDLKYLNKFLLFLFLRHSYQDNNNYFPLINNSIFLNIIMSDKNFDIGFVEYRLNRSFYNKNDNYQDKILQFVHDEYDTQILNNLCNDLGYDNFQSFTQTGAFLFRVERCIEIVQNSYEKKCCLL